MSILVLDILFVLINVEISVSILSLILSKDN